MQEVMPAFTKAVPISSYKGLQVEVARGLGWHVNGRVSPAQGELWNAEKPLFQCQSIGCEVINLIESADASLSKSKSRLDADGIVRFQPCRKKPKSGSVLPCFQPPAKARLLRPAAR